MAMNSAPQTPAAIFNGYIGSCTIAALQHLGLLDRLASNRGLTLDEMYEDTGGAEAPGASRGRIRALVEAALRLGLLDLDKGGMLHLSHLGQDVRQEVGFFVWAVNGYGEFFNSLSEIVHEPTPNWAKYRNGAMVALGSDLCNEHLMQPILDEILESISFKKIADLGCGNAGRLINACSKFQGIKGVGADINQDAILMARDLVQMKNLSDRISLHQVDVFKKIRDENTESFSDVDVVMSFMMLHDLFNMDEPSTIISQIRNAFPNARRFIFADTVRTGGFDEPRPASIFGPGFELVHGVMGIKTFPLKTYIDAFEGAGLRIERSAPFGAPSTYIFLLSSI